MAFNETFLNEVATAVASKIGYVALLDASYNEIPNTGSFPPYERQVPTWANSGTVLRLVQDLQFHVANGLNVSYVAYIDQTNQYVLGIEPVNPPINTTEQSVVTLYSYNTVIRFYNETCTPVDIGGGGSTES